MYILGVNDIGEEINVMKLIDLVSNSNPPIDLWLTRIFGKSASNPC